MATGYRLYLDTGPFGPSVGDGISGTQTLTFDTTGLSPSNGAYVTYPSLGYERSGLIYYTGCSYYFVPHNAWDLPADEAGTISVVQTPHYLGSGNDYYVSGAGDDLIYSGPDASNDGTGNKYIDAGAGDDQVFFGDGYDTVHGGDGNDVIGGYEAARAGNNLLYGDAGNDTIHGGTGDDWISGGMGDDYIYGDDDQDTIFLTDWHGNDFIDGGEGGSDYDTIWFANWMSTQGVTVTFAGDEAGTYSYVEPGVNTGGTFHQIEAISGTEYADTLDASYSGADQQLFANGGDDIVIGGYGADQIDGGSGADTLTGGAGADTFVFAPGDGADTITDFNTGNTGTLSDGDSTNNDFIDLSAFYDDIWELRADQADDGVLNQSNDGIDGVDYSDNTRFKPCDSLTFTGAIADGFFFTVENTGVVCFLRGTAILTPADEVPVERLRAGDRVVTADHGVQPIRIAPGARSTSRRSTGAWCARGWPRG